MNYEELSDFEVNKAVAEALGAIPERAILQHFPPSPAINLATEGRFNGWKLDYCNNPSDAWPIIVEHKISVQHSSSMGYSFDQWDANASAVDDEGDCMCYGHADDNPLRAAMTV